MSVDWKTVSVSHVVPILTCFCQSVHWFNLFLFVSSILRLPLSTPVHFLTFVFTRSVINALLWWMWPFGTSSYLYIFYLPVSLISLSDCTPYFHISPLSFFVPFLLTVVHIKHWHQIDSHVNKAAVGGQRPLPWALKLHLILSPFTPSLNTHIPSFNALCPTSGFGRLEPSRHTKYFFAISMHLKHNYLISLIFPWS